MLLTGMHTVADVVCIVCDEVVGWKYVCCVHLVCHLGSHCCDRAVASIFVLCVILFGFIVCWRCGRRRHGRATDMPSWPFLVWLVLRGLACVVLTLLLLTGCPRALPSVCITVVSLKLAAGGLRGSAKVQAGQVYFGEATDGQGTWLDVASTVAASEHAFGSPRFQRWEVVGLGARPGPLGYPSWPFCVSCARPVSLARVCPSFSPESHRVPGLVEPLRYILRLWTFCSAARSCVAEVFGWPWPAALRCPSASGNEWERSVGRVAVLGLRSCGYLARYGWRGCCSIVRRLARWQWDVELNSHIVPSSLFGFHSFRYGSGVARSGLHVSPLDDVLGTSARRERVKRVSDERVSCMKSCSATITFSLGMCSGAIASAPAGTGAMLPLWALL